MPRTCQQMDVARLPSDGIYDNETLPYMEALEAHRRSFPGGTICVRWRDSLTTVKIFPLLLFFSLFSYQSVKVFSHLFFISSLVLIFFITIYFFYIYILLINFFIQLHPSSFGFIWFLYQIWSLFFIYFLKAFTKWILFSISSLNIWF
jgi:hypothetical protein